MAQIKTVYEHIHSNNIKTALLVLLFPLIFIGLVFMVFNAIITPLLRMAISRNREYTADATGAHITRNPGALASALKKISTNSRVECLNKVKSMSSTCIANPSAPREFIGDLMATHPPIDKRIERLESMNIK